MSVILVEKMKALRTYLKISNKEVFGEVEVNESLALQQVSFWDDQKS